MPRRSLRYHQRHDSDDEFETPAFQAAAEQNNLPAAVPNESEDELQSESGLGESPEEDLIEDAEQSSDDDDKDDGRLDNDDSEDEPLDEPLVKSWKVSSQRKETLKDEIVRGINQEKEKRRKKDELFKLQKKEKLAALNKRKLPEDLLEELTKHSEKKQKIDPDQKPSKASKVTFSSEEEDLGSDLEEAEEAGTTDFIPLEGMQEKRVQVVSLQSQKGRSSGKITESVANLKHSLLFGGSLKRITTEQARLQKAKRLARRQ